MKRINFEGMSVDELWGLHEEVGVLLTQKMKAEKRELEGLLDKLQRHGSASPRAPKQRRPYPKVHPKFQNPDEPSQTWAGRGRTPRWMNELLKAGRSIDELQIDRGCE
jgi:DNA-binding protein H-NS